MGAVDVTITITNPANPKKSFTGKVLVDTGAQYTVLPEKIWKQIGLKPLRKETFSLADGTHVERAVGEAKIKFDGKEATGPIVLGKKTDTLLLGVVNLEILGLVVNPFTRELKPAKMML